MPDLRQQCIDAGASTPWLTEHTVPFVAAQVAAEVLDAFLSVLTENADEVWWCEEHESPWLQYKESDPDPEDACAYWYWRNDVTEGRERPEFLCRMTQQIRLPLDVLRDGRTDNLVADAARKYAEAPITPAMIERAAKVFYTWTNDGMLPWETDSDAQAYRDIAETALTAALWGDDPDA
jgi:hypothetical protein